MCQCGEATVLTKKYQKKLTKVMKLANIIMSALAVFETSISKLLNNGKVDEWEFAALHTLHLGALNELANVDHKMEYKRRIQLRKSLLEEINDLKKVVRGASHNMHTLPHVLSHVLPQCQKWISWQAYTTNCITCVKGRKLLRSCESLAIN